MRCLFKCILTLCFSELRAIIQEYKHYHQDSGSGQSNLWAGFDPEACTWQEVLNEMENAEAEYRQKGQKNLLRRVLRHGEAVGRNFAPFLDGLPDEKGLGLLKGGLVVLFNV